MQEFLSRWAVKWNPSSPEHPQSNGSAEGFVKKCKYLVMKNEGRLDEQFFKDLLAERHLQTNGTTPMIRMFRRNTRSLLPQLERLQNAEEVDKELEQADKKVDVLQDKRAHYYNLRARKKDLPPLKVGQRVLVYDNVKEKWNKFAKVLKTLANRKYKIRCEDSVKNTIRNRIALKEVAEEN